MDESHYQIKLSTDVELTYEDGFADGYSRAWQECWDYVRRELSGSQNKPDDSHAPKQEGGA